MVVHNQPTLESLMPLLPILIQLTGANSFTKDAHHQHLQHYLILWQDITTAQNTPTTRCIIKKGHWDHEMSNENLGNFIIYRYDQNYS